MKKLDTFFHTLKQVAFRTTLSEVMRNAGLLLSNSNLRVKMV